jgi:hypothetical protein
MLCAVPPEYHPGQRRKKRVVTKMVFFKAFNKHENDNKLHAFICSEEYT